MNRNTSVYLRKAFGWSKSLLFVLMLLSTTSALEIMTWIPPYSIANCKNSLEATWGDTCAPRFTITILAAQWYNCSISGSVELQSGVEESDVTWAKSFCSKNKIKLLMCITNFGVSDFDWNIAVGCYKTNQAAFISNVMSLVESNGFDGVDIDFEGYETGYQSDYADCVKELATRLHAIGKILSIDTYPYIWNNPSINWWKDWLGYVDFINPMQYRGGELDPTNYYQWTWRQDFGTDLGYKASQIMLSFPGDLDSWPYGKFGDDLLSHIRETQELTKAPGPISIWDCEFQAVGWRTAEVWQALHKIKLTGNSSTVVLAAKSGPQVTLRTPFAKAINGQILISVPTSDSYEVKLYSTRGQRIGVIYKGMIEAGTEPLSILTHSLPTANYLVEITSPKIRSTSLIVIK